MLVLWLFDIGWIFGLSFSGNSGTCSIGTHKKVSTFCDTVDFRRTPHIVFFGAEGSFNSSRSLRTALKFMPVFENWLLLASLGKRLSWEDGWKTSRRRGVPSCEGMP